MHNFRARSCCVKVGAVCRCEPRKENKKGKKTKKGERRNLQKQKGKGVVGVGYLFARRTAISRIERVLPSPCAEFLLLLLLLLLLFGSLLGRCKIWGSTENGKANHLLSEFPFPRSPAPVTLVTGPGCGSKGISVTKSDP